MPMAGEVEKSGRDMSDCTRDKDIFPNNCRNIQNLQLTIGPYAISEWILWYVNYSIMKS